MKKGHLFLKIYSPIFLLVLIISLLFTRSIYAQDSTYTRLWDNGEIKVEGKYQNGKKEGDWQKWNDKGELIEKYVFQQGSLITKTVNEYYIHTKNLLYETKIFNPNNILVEKRSYSSQNNEIYAKLSFHDNGELKVILKKTSNGFKE